MKHVVVLAHPNPLSFNASIAGTYIETVTKSDGSAILRNLYALNFDPRLPLSELPLTCGFEVSPEVATERANMEDADVIALIYPLWLNTPPAIMKGFLERVFGYGFGYGKDTGGTRPLLSGKKLITFSTSGAPTDWVKKTGSMDALRTLFDDHLAAMCGLHVVDHVHFGNIISVTRDDVINDYLATVRTKVKQLSS